MYILAKYNTATTIYFPMVKRGLVDLAATADWTPANGDCNISKDGGAQANPAGTVAISTGVTWKLALSGTELSAAIVQVMIVDSATKAVEDQWLEIRTYGNASAYFINDPTLAATAANLTQIDGVANASATFNLTKLNIVNTGGDALVATSSGSNGSGFAITGNGSGPGVKINGGATGSGLYAAGGATSGAGANFAALGGNSNGLECDGHGSESGIYAAGGATGNGITGFGGATSGHGIQGAGNGAAAGSGIQALSLGAPGFQATGGTNSNGIDSLGTGTGSGISASGGTGASAGGLKLFAGAGSNGNGFAANGDGSGNGMSSTAGATGQGILTIGGSTSGSGIFARGGASGSGDGIRAAGGTAAGTGNGIKAIGGVTSGHGISVTTTSGDGINLTPTAGHGITSTGNGTSKHGLFVTGGTAGTSDGLSAVAGTGGVPIRGSRTGDLTGNVSGSVGSVTGAVGSVTGSVGSVTGNVNGNVTNVTGSIGSIAAGGITASSIATAAIDADALAADAVDEIWDEQVGDGSITARQAVRVLIAGMAGVLAGGGTTTITIRNLANTADVVIATVDANGNRSAVTVTP